MCAGWREHVLTLCTVPCVCSGKPSAVWRQQPKVLHLLDSKLSEPNTMQMIAEPYMHLSLSYYRGSITALHAQLFSYQHLNLFRR